MWTSSRWIQKHRVNSRRMALKRQKSSTGHHGARRRLVFRFCRQQTRPRTDKNNHTQKHTLLLLVQVFQAVFTPSYLREEKTVSSECVQKMREPLLQVPRCLGVPKCGAGRSSSEAESGDEEECEEEEEDADEFRAPIELLAEFLKAVMEKKYTLAKKLCQMILIYEPENPEAKHFLPLIEERLLIEEAQKGSSGEDDTSDDDDDDDDDDNDDDESSSSGSGDDDDDDDDTDTCTDSDGDGRKEEDISQR
ncbi:glutamate-rich protein 2 isoform X4 [Pangasianodon hypophthalmus]|uniref:glutamate-rich protein 2 isoform X4 n=1 Tax=Pangasianodon hypophthalmus TaxID=310915 RepID=UPI000EFEEDDF|nr:glutamate-rich protein 2 isoform X4 [Pangasianodon hypophthalmus]